MRIYARMLQKCIPEIPIKYCNSIDIRIISENHEKSMKNIVLL
jgi:hypothetical protein